MHMSDKMLKSVKVSTKTNSKPKGKKSAKVKTATVGSTSTIKNFFVPSESNGCVEKAAPDSRAVYVKALKDRLKNYDGEKENISGKSTAVKNESADVCNEPNNPQCAGIENSATDGDQNNVQCVNIEDAATVDPVWNNRKVTRALDLSTNDDDFANAVDLNGERTGKLCDASCDVLRKKYKDLKKEHFQLCHTHCQLTMKYEQLVKTLDAVRKAKSCDAEITDMPPPTDDVFTPNQIRILESLPLEKKKDSTFILKCVEYAYTDNTSALVNKTLFGTLERKEFGENGAVLVRAAKDPLTPEKVKRIEELFVKRVTESKCHSAEFTERIVPININKLIASAIRNVVSKETPKKLQQNVNLDL